VKLESFQSGLTIGCRIRSNYDYLGDFLFLKVNIFIMDTFPHLYATNVCDDAEVVVMVRESLANLNMNFKNRSQVCLHIFHNNLVARRFRRAVFVNISKFSTNLSLRRQLDVQPPYRRYNGHRQDVSKMEDDSISWR